MTSEDFCAWKRSSELLGLAQLHVAASLLATRSAVSARHLLQQPQMYPATCPAPGPR